jgi:phosphoserine/homoserine phosphotransferase
MAFQSIGYRCLAAGDSYNDIQMFEVAEKGFFMNAPEKIAAGHPEIPSFHNYDDLKNAILESSVFVK